MSPGSRLGRRCDAWLATVVALLSACASDSSCDLVGCTDGLEIRAVSNEPLPAGRYDVTLTLGSQSGSCTAFVPSSAGSTTCDAALPVSLYATATEFVIGVHSDPSVVAVRVDHEDQTAGEAEFEPDYRTVHPNGPNCEPTCHIADAEEFSLAL
jgi:hypothetical protein